MSERICKCGCTKALKFCPECGEPYKAADPTIVALENALAHATKRHDWWVKRPTQGTTQDADKVLKYSIYWDNQRFGLENALKHENERLADMDALIPLTDEE